MCRCVRIECPHTTSICMCLSFALIDIMEVYRAGLLAYSRRAGQVQPRSKPRPRPASLDTSHV